MTRFNALLAATATALLTVSAPALARDKKPEKAEEGKTPALKLSKAVQPLLLEGDKLAKAGDNPGAVAKYRQAEALPGITDDDKFALASYKTNAAIAGKDEAALEEAAKSRLALGRDNPKTNASLARLIGANAYNKRDIPTAIQYFEKSLTYMPDEALAADVSQLYINQKQYPQAYATLQKLNVAATAAGGKPPEARLQRMLAIAYDAKMTSEIPGAATALVRAYPTPKNWRDAVLITQVNSKLDDDASLDLFRLLRVTGSLTGERDYVEFAETLGRKGLPGEARAVLDEGIAKGALAPAKAGIRETNAAYTPARVAADKASLPSSERDARKSPNGKLALVTGDSYFAYGNFAKAADLYRLALTKGGIDTDRANIRLGVALARSGDKAGARAALALVKAPQRVAVAQFWSIWLDQQA